MQVGTTLKNSIFGDTIELPFIPENLFSSLHRIGFGKSLGMTMIGKWKNHDIILRIQNNYTEDQIEYFHNIIKTKCILKDYPGIGNLYGFSMIKNKMILLFKYYKHKNLSSYLKVNDISKKRLYSFAIKAAEIIMHIHSNKIICNNIQLGNFLIDDDEETLVFLELSLAFILGDRTSKFFPALIEYSAPETLIRKELSFKTDIYSFGLFLWELGMYGKVNAFKTTDPVSLSSKIISGERPDMHQDWDTEYSKLIQKCFSHDPDSRPRSFEEILATLTLLKEAEK